MQWWDNLWLNEGFATWMENRPLAAMHPEWNMDQTVAVDVDRTLNVDAQASTRSIRAKAETPDEINQMFDGIAYGKAGAVLLGIENYLGEDTFRQGVHNYLAAHLYSNATAEDFWGAQTATSHKPVDKIMKSLVAQPGVPLLTFGDPVGGKLPVAQKRFFVSPSIQPDPAQKWTLPVCFKTGAETQDCQVLTPAESALKAPAGSLFFANSSGKGYYRSAYSPSAYKALVAGVETSLTPTERINLIGDEWAQVRANKATVGDYLDLVAAVKADANAEVLNSAIDGVNLIASRIAVTPQEKAAVSAWIRRTFAPELAKLGTPSDADSANTSELRAQLFGVLGFYGKDPAVLAQANKIAQQYLADPASVDATLGQTALYIAAHHGNAALFDQLQTIFETSTNPEIQEGALHRLVDFEDPALVERAMDYAVSDKVRNQDAAYQFMLAFQNDANRDLVWKYMQSHWAQIQAQLTTESGGYLVNAMGSFCSADARNEVKSFFATHKVAASDKALQHAIERINGCTELRSLQEPKLQQWLAAQPKL
jgi:aminopeptidase N/puromycin-sensitive aminopeptidase